MILVSLKLSHNWHSSTNSSRSPAKTHLVLLEHFILFQRLHGVYLARIGLLDQSDFSKRALSNDLDGTEIVQSNPCPSQPEETGHIVSANARRTSRVRASSGKSNKVGWGVTHLDSRLPSARSWRALRVSGVMTSAPSCFSRPVLLQTSCQRANSWPSTRSARSDWRHERGKERRTSLYARQHLQQSPCKTARGAFWPTWLCPKCFHQIAAVYAQSTHSLVLCCFRRIPWRTSWN